MKEFTYDDVLKAYRKLKNYIYYDSTSIFLRKELAEFEANTDFKKRLERLVTFLNNSKSDKDYFQSLLKRINYYIIPKKINGNDEKSPVISNKFDFADYDISKITYLINAPIEIHIISVLWIIEIGYTLEGEYFHNNYAYKLNKDNSDNNDNSLKPLYKRYFKQYQKWRDNAVYKAQNALKEKYDVLVLGLDIKDYFHSINIDFDEINEFIQQKINSSVSSLMLNNYLKEICEKYSSILPNSGDYTILPIGLLSSGILANWYFRSIDKQLYEKIRPAYYGRYVDDLLLVIINPIKHTGVKNGKDYYDYVIKNYFIKNKIMKKTRSNKEYCFNSLPNLILQKDKIVLYEFDKNSTSALLDNFTKAIAKNSSEFRFLPEDNKVSSEFDEEANQLLYNGSINKLRSVIKFQQDKYSASKFLAKKIFTSLLSETEKDEKTINQIMTFFKGKINLECMMLWEKILIYFIINNLEYNVIKFIRTTIKTINRIKYKPENVRLSKETIDGIEDRIKYDLKDYLKISLSIALTLEPSFYNKIKKSIDKEFIDSFEINNSFSNIESTVSNIRIANLIRHNYVFHPLINYTSDARNLKTSYIKRNIFKDYDSNLLFEINDTSCILSPRNISFYEACVFVINKNLYLAQKSKEVLPIDTTAFINEAHKIYFLINNKKISENIFTQNATDINTFDDLKNHVLIDEINIKNEKEKDKIKVAIANTIVDNKNQVASIKNKPNLSITRKHEIIDLLNNVSSKKVELFVLPENYTPFSWVDFLATYSKKNSVAIVAGLEHLIINNNAYNFIVTILPFFDNNGYKDALVSIRLKNHYAPKEEFDLTNKYRYSIPKNNPYIYNLFTWRGVKFSVFYCYELTNIYHRSIFRSKIDLLIASEYNKDVDYFSNIVETTVRDIHCYFMQVNSTDFGDSRITQPKGSYLMNLIRIKGGLNNTFLVEELDIKALRDFQSQNITAQLFKRNSNPDDFKLTPPDYDHTEAQKR